MGTAQELLQDCTRRVEGARPSAKHPHTATCSSWRFWWGEAWNRRDPLPLHLQLKQELGVGFCRRRLRAQPLGRTWRKRVNREVENPARVRSTRSGGH